MSSHVAPRRARRVRGRARAPLKKEYTAVFGAVPLLRADPGRDVPLQQARPAVRAAAELPVLPPEDGGRLGLGQEPPDPDHPARRGLHLERRDGRGAARRGRRAEPDRGGAGRADRRVASARTTSSSSSSLSRMALAGGRRRATRRRSSGSSTATSWPSTGASRPSAAARGDELGALLRRLPRPRARSTGSASPRRCRSCIRAYEEFAARYAEAELLDARARGSGPGSRSATTTRARSGPTGSRTRSRAVERYGAPCIVVDFGTSTNFDVVSRRGRVRRRRARAGDRDLDGRALRAGGAPVQGRLRRAADRDRRRRPRRAAVRARLRLRRPGGRDRRPDPRGARRRRAGRRDGRPRRADRPARADDRDGRPVPDARGRCASSGSGTASTPAR